MYKNHADIPNKFRRLILDETLQKRVSKVPLKVCNEIIQNAIEEEQENETLKNYEVEYIKDGIHQVEEASDRQSALVIVDRVLDYGDSDDKNIMIAVRQAKRLIAGYANGEWIDIPPKDALRIKRRK